jgi:hypothetical protein
VVWFGFNVTRVAGRKYLSLHILLLPATVPANKKGEGGVDIILHTCAYILYKSVAQAHTTVSGFVIVVYLSKDFQEVKVTLNLHKNYRSSKQLFILTFEPVKQ